MRRRTVIIMLAVVAVFLGSIPIAAYAYLAWTTRDAPEPASLDEAPGGVAGGPTAIDGRWAPAPGATSYVGYRMRERVGPVSAPSDAVGRSRALEGTFTIEGSRLTKLDFTVDMTALRSDSSRRDEIVRDESLETGRFPTARFTLDDPVDGEAPRQGRVVKLRVPGKLTLHGVTRNVSFDVQARWNGPTIQAAGSTRIERGDFGIETGGLAGFSVAETGTIEFELTLAPPGATVEGATPDTLADNPETPTASDDVVPCQSDGATPPLASPMLVTNNSGVAMIVAGSGQTSVAYASPGRLDGASWSPDGTTILFAGSPTRETQPALATIPAGGGAPTPLANLGGTAQPDWGPNGEIVFVKNEGDGSDLWIADADGANARRLVATPGADRDPRWSPDGRWVVFSNLAGAHNQDVMLVRADGTSLRAIASTKGYEYAPSFSPDSKTVVFVRDGAIREIGLDDDHSRPLTNGADDANPSLSPDGTQLAFVRAGSLHVAGADGAEPHCVQTDQAIGGGPRWRP